MHAQENIPTDRPGTSSTDRGRLPTAHALPRVTAATMDQPLIPTRSPFRSCDFFPTQQNSKRFVPLNAIHFQAG